MSLIITCNDDAPIPRRTQLRMVCDGKAKWTCRREQLFDHGEYIANYRAAIADGWKETQMEGGRAHLCPECSRKKVIFPNLMEIT